MKKVNENQKKFTEELKERKLEIAGLKREKERLAQDAKLLGWDERRRKEGK